MRTQEIILMVVFRQMAMWNGFACELSKLKRILKPTGSFVLDIKDKVVDGERHTYVLELVLALIKGKSVSGWVEEYIWHKITAAPGKWKYRFRDAWERILHFSKTKDIQNEPECCKDTNSQLEGYAASEI